MCALAECYYHAASSSELSERSRRRRASVKIRWMTSRGLASDAGNIDIAVGVRSSLVLLVRSTARRCPLQQDCLCHTGCDAALLPRGYASI